MNKAIIPLSSSTTDDGWGGLESWICRASTLGSVQSYSTSQPKGNATTAVLEYPTRTFERRKDRHFIGIRIKDSWVNMRQEAVEIQFTCPTFYNATATIREEMNRSGFSIGAGLLSNGSITRELFMILEDGRARVLASELKQQILPHSL